jgi:hypothetical protein
MIRQVQCSSSANLDIASLSWISSSSLTPLREILSGAYPEVPGVRPAVHLTSYSAFCRTWCTQLLRDPRANGSALQYLVAVTY